MKEIEKWLLKSDMKADIEQLNDIDRQDAFNGELSFGTGGIRGILGPGTNRLNKYVIRRVTYGYGLYLKQKYATSAVVIAHDNRHNSALFAEIAARTLTSFNIRVFLFTSLRPTPELSFAVRHLKAQGGIVITASHNPKEYNGYKVYDESGAQLNLNDSASLINTIATVGDVFDLPIVENEKLIIPIDEEVDNAYLKEIEKLKYREVKSNLKIVYTPLHGAAYKLVIAALKQRGHTLFEVSEQTVPDPDFSATKSANPEEEAAYEKAILLAKQVGADIILATDPDGDRIGVVAADNYDYHFLSGNQTGGLLIDYVLGALKGCMPLNPIVYNTIVTSRFGETIAKSYNVPVVSTLTGFKFIGEQIRLNESLENGSNFVFGYEESYGYLLSPIVRDKDAVQAAVAIAEMAAYYKNAGMNLVRQLNYLYHVHGFFAEGQINLVLKGSDGQKQIEKIMEKFRSCPPKRIGQSGLICREDYELSESVIGANVSKITLPQSNVLKYIYDCGSFVAIRPSGTEPKLKVYLAIRDKDDAEKKLAFFKTALSQLLKEYNAA